MKSILILSWVLVNALFLGSLTSILAQSPLPGLKSTPAMKEVGEPEGDALHFQPMAVDPRIYQMNDPYLSDLARRIENGSANLIQRRAFYWLVRRLYPFDKPIPPGWRLKARNVIKASELERAKRAESTRAPSSVFTWTNLGPAGFPDGSGDTVSGRGTAIWVDPSNKNTILLGTADGGVWKTTTQGAAWTPIFDSAATLSIGAIGVDPSNKNIIFVGTGEGNFSGDTIGGLGLYKSSDGGITWSLLSTPPWNTLEPHHSIRRVLIDPRNGGAVVVATDDGLWYSGDGGGTWNRSTLGLGASPYTMTDLYMDPTSAPFGTPAFLYAAIGAIHGDPNNGIYRSTNGPAGPWVKISASPYGSGFPASDVGRITLVPTSSPKRVYALLQSVSTYSSLGVYSTMDLTANPVVWTLGSTTNFCGQQGWYDLAGVTNPANPGQLIVGGLDDYASPDGGASLYSISDWTSWGTYFSHADHHFFAMPDATTLYDANDGGFFIATLDWSGPSASWVNKNAGLGTLQFYGMANDPADSGKYQGGLQDNGQVYFDGSSSSQVQGGDGGVTVWDPTDANYAYQEYVYGEIRRNTSMVATPSTWTCFQDFGGCTCSYGCIPDGHTDFIAPFALDANNPNGLYLGTNRLWWTPVARTSTSWVAISASLTPSSSSYITAIHSAYNNANAGVVYIGTLDGRFWVTTNGGSNYHDRSAGMSGGPISSIATDPTNAIRVIAAVSGFGTWHINVSTDGGLTWNFVTAGLPSEPFNAVVLDPSDPNHAYAGSDYGIFENTAVWSSSTWSSITYNMPAVSVQQLTFSPTTYRLRAATHGRGIWEAVPVTTGPPNPKETSPFHNLKAVKGPGGASINVTYTNACNATGNTVYAGNLSTLKPPNGISWTSRFCTMGTSGALSFSPGSGNVYFVVVGHNDAGIEGSYGQSSATVERPPAGQGSPCSYTLNLSGTCP